MEPVADRFGHFNADVRMLVDTLFQKSENPLRISTAVSGNTGGRSNAAGDGLSAFWESTEEYYG